MADQVAALRHLYGDRWEFWTVPRIVPVGVLWCARSRADRRVLQAHSAAALAKAVQDWEAVTRSRRRRPR
ncbi:MAG TPA: hypothetical protein VGS19_10580 [Streptosporangiaceae bacterium]|nr:hypothetical protein [Streptosporangiaceae bacterium]